MSADQDNAQPGSERHTAFTEWVQQQGVTIKGVEPAEFNGRGLGMVAIGHLKVVEPEAILPWNGKS